MTIQYESVCFNLFLMVPLWCRTSRRKSFYKKVFWEISQKNSLENTCAGVFFDKITRCRSATFISNETPAQVFFVNFAKFVRTPFLQNTTGRLLLIIAVSIVVKGHYDAEIKTPIWLGNASYQKGQSRRKNNFNSCFRRRSLEQNQVRLSAVHTEAVVRMCSLKKVFLEILQNSQENNCATDSLLIKLQAWGKPLTL